MMKKLTHTAAGLVAVALLTVTATGEPITNPFPEPVEDADVRVGLELVAEGLISPVWGTNAADDSDRFFVADQSGVIRIIRDGQLVERPFLSVRRHMVELQEGFDERGLIGLVFHPNFAREGESGYGTFYTYTSEPVEPHAPAEFQIEMPEDLPPNHIGVLSEWVMDDHTVDTVDPESRRIVMTVDEPQFNHNGGAMAFGPDNLLYISFGDGGAANDFGPGHTADIGNGQDTSRVLGKILRIDPLCEQGTPAEHGRYSIPDDNPFVGDDDVLDVIYAYGLRNVFLMSFDDDRLIAADVGQEHVEMVKIIEAGRNYGWNLMEGTFYFDPTAERGRNIYAEPLDHRPVPDDIAMPALQYDHDEGTSIMGGFVYRGSAIEDLQGLYVFGDWQRQEVPGRDGTAGRLFVGDLDSGELWGLPIGDGDSHTQGLVTGFGEDEDGEIYVLTNDTAGPRGTNGKVWKIVPYRD